MIGDILLKEREKQKLSIQDIEQGTSIRAVYIDALEKGEYDKLPGEVYAKGFIKNYGNFLELNGEDLVRQFIAEITPVVTESETPQTENLKSESELVAKTKIAAKNISQTFQASVQNNSTEDSDSQKYIFVAVAGILLLIGGLFYGFSDSDSQPSEVVTVETQQVAPVEQPKPVPAVETVTVASTPTPQPVNDVNLQATFSDDCWTRVVVDGAMVYEGMINAGQTFDWKGNENINVLLGNAGAVQIMKNGQNVGSLGAAGDVVERTFTR